MVDVLNPGAGMVVFGGEEDLGLLTLPGCGDIHERFAGCGTQVCLSMCPHPDAASIICPEIREAGNHCHADEVILAQASDRSMWSMLT